MSEVVPERIVFFDGVCNFCNSTVDRIVRNNKGEKIYFASLQSGFAERFLGKYGIRNHDLDTVIYYRQGKFFFRTTALIEVSKELKGVYKLLPAFYIFPGFLRDAGYNWFARNRYRFFGKRETCRVPTPEERQLFLDNA